MIFKKINDHFAKLMSLHSFKPSSCSIDILKFNEICIFNFRSLKFHKFLCLAQSQMKST